MGLIAVAIVKTRRPRQVTRGFASIWYFGGALLIVAAIALTATGFAGYLTAGTLGGWSLLWHVVAIGPFLLGLLLCVGYAAWSGRTLHGYGASRRSARVQRGLFWVTTLAALVTSGTMLVAMLPVLATDGMEASLAVHRYSGLVFVGLGLLYLVMRATAKQPVKRS
jgi:hypothetical protein